MTAAADNEQCDFHYWEISKNTTEHDDPVSNIAGIVTEEFDDFVIVPPHSQRNHYVPPQSGQMQLDDLTGSHYHSLNADMKGR